MKKVGVEAERAAEAMRHVRAGDYVLCRQRGMGGDLIVGLVRSVRRMGKVPELNIIATTNLLTGNTSYKELKVLCQRNIIVSKKQALEVVAVFERTRDKKQTREAAVRIVDVLLGRNVIKLKTGKPAGKKPTVALVMGLYRALSQEGQAEVAKQIWPALLRASRQRA